MQLKIKCIQQCFWYIFFFLFVNGAFCNCQKDITFHLNLTFRKPSNNIAARWFPILDSTFSFSYMMDTYIIYYSPVQVRLAQSTMRKLKVEIKKKPDTVLSAKFIQEEKTFFAVKSDRKLFWRETMFLINRKQQLEKWKTK